MGKFVIADKNDLLIKTINDRLQSIATTLCGNKTDYLKNDRFYASYEIPLHYSNYFKSAMVEEISKALVFNTKNKLYGENIPFDEKDIYSFVLKRALIFSDFENSIDLLKSEIIKFDEFHLDGIQNFLLRDEIEEWNAISYATKKTTICLNLKKNTKNT